MRIDWRTTPGPDLEQAVRAWIAPQKTLEDVVRAGLSLSPPRLIEDVIVQDEYTHDVVMPFAAAAPTGSIYLVYDAT